MYTLNQFSNSRKPKKAEIETYIYKMIGNEISGNVIALAGPNIFRHIVNSEYITKGKFKYLVAENDYEVFEKQVIQEFDCLIFNDDIFYVLIRNCIEHKMKFAFLDFDGCTDLETFKKYEFIKKLIEAINFGCLEDVFFINITITCRTRIAKDTNTKNGVIKYIEEIKKELDKIGYKKINYLVECYKDIKGPPMFAICLKIINTIK